MIRPPLPRRARRPLQWLSVVGLLAISGWWVPPARCGTEPSEVPVPAKITRYAERLVQSYDTDGDRRLGESEWSRLRGEPREADADGDAIVTIEEFAQHVALFAYRRAIRLRSPRHVNRPAADTPADGTESADTKAAPAGGPVADVEQEGSATDALQRLFASPLRRLAGLPEWFGRGDQNGDGQLTMAEFSQSGATGGPAAFAKYDLNGDGVLIPKEYIRAAKQQSTDK